MRKGAASILSAASLGRAGPPTHLQRPRVPLLKGEQVKKAGLRMQDQGDGRIGGRNSPFIDRAPTISHTWCLMLYTQVRKWPRDLW